MVTFQLLNNKGKWKIYFHHVTITSLSDSVSRLVPNSIKFQVEMHDFFGDDCSDDGGVSKNTTKEGSGLSNPREGSTVSVSWSMKHLDRDLETRSVKFILGDGAGEGVSKCFIKYQLSVLHHLQKD